VHRTVILLEKHLQVKHQVFQMKAETLLLKKNLSTKARSLRHKPYYLIFMGFWLFGWNKVIRLKNQGFQICTKVEAGEKVFPN
jgi:hypothetical protein